MCWVCFQNSSAQSVSPHPEQMLGLQRFEPGRTSGVQLSPQWPSTFSWSPRSLRRLPSQVSPWLSQLSYLKPCWKSCFFRPRHFFQCFKSDVWDFFWLAKIHRIHFFLVGKNPCDSFFRLARIPMIHVFVYENLTVCLALNYHHRTQPMGQACQWCVEGGSEAAGETQGGKEWLPQRRTWSM